jgi:hypothetical protein
MILRAKEYFTISFHKYMWPRIVLRRTRTRYCNSAMGPLHRYHVGGVHHSGHQRSPVRIARSPSIDPALLQ